MISNCGIDEKGNITGGEAGDQTGREWRIISWYDKPWYCILRHPDAKVREMIANFAKAAAENDNIGYDQRERTTFYDRLKEVDWNPANITVRCEADCSSGVMAIIIAVGHVLNILKLAELSPKLCTGDMRRAFRDAGFEVITDRKYRNSDRLLLPGDILLNDNQHTAINLSVGSEVRVTDPEPRVSEPVVEPIKKTIEELAKEVIRGDWGNGQERIYRLTAAGYNASEIQNEVNRMLGINKKPESKGIKFRVCNITTHLNIRSGPSTTNLVVGKMYNNDEFVVENIETVNNFIKIDTNKWVSANFVTRI